MSASVNGIALDPEQQEEPALWKVQARGHTFQYPSVIRFN